MRQEAICLECGRWKSAPFAGCSACGFVPKPGSDDELKSVYLSLGRYDNGGEREKYRAQLCEMAGTIASGGSISFDAKEIARLSEQRNQFRSASTSAAWLAVMRFFLPAVLFLGALVLLIIFLKSMR